MILLSLSMCLAAMFPQFSSEASPKFADFMTSNVVIQKKILNMHNNLRRKVKPTASNMLKMSWSSTVAGYAQRWANQCILRHSSEESRKINGLKCGENIYMAPAPFPWSRVIQEWYDEVKIFRLGTGPTTSGMIGHYTQIVWYNSRELGCALAYCPRETTHKYFYVCHYCPTGNWDHRKYQPYTVGRPCGACPQACNKGLCTNPCMKTDEYNNCENLKKTGACNSPTLEQCRATCECTTEIV